MICVLRARRRASLPCRPIASVKVRTVDDVGAADACSEARGGVAQDIHPWIAAREHAARRDGLQRHASGRPPVAPNAVATRDHMRRAARSFAMSIW